MRIRLGEWDEFCGAIGQGALCFLAGHGGDQVYRTGTEGNVGVKGLRAVEVRSIEGKHAIQGYVDAVSFVEAVKLNPASAQEAHIAQGNVLVLRQSDDFLARKRVSGVEVDGVL